jgi:hypothetical protein
MIRNLLPLFALFVALNTSGCLLFTSDTRPEDERGPGDGMIWPRYKFMKTPGNVEVDVPEVLWEAPTLLKEAFAEIDAAMLPHPELSHWFIRIRESMIFVPHAFQYGATWARGVTHRPQARLDVGWQFMGERKRLPALEHERDHALHPEDPCFGHGDECGNGGNH